MTVPTELTPGAIAGAIARMQSARAPLRVVRPAVAAAVVVEMVGPAGAGKSTVRDRVLARLDAGASAPVERGGERGGERSAARTAALALAHAPTWGPAAAELLRASPRDARERLRHLVRVHTLRAELPRLRAGAGRALVLDEGPVFSLVRLADAPAAADGALARYLRGETFAWAACLDTVVWLDASDAVLVRRIRERAKAHRMKHRSDLEIRDFLRAYRRDFDHVVGALEALGVRVAHVDTTREPVDAVAERVCAIIDGGRRAR